jgi:hypothetical protein
VIEAVTFDFWETLVSERNGGRAEEVGTMRTMQLRGWLEVLGAAGLERTEGQVAAAFDRNWERFHERWYANEPHGLAEATEEICLALDVDPSPEVRGRRAVAPGARDRGEPADAQGRRRAPRDRLRRGDDALAGAA